MCRHRLLHTGFYGTSFMTWSARGHPKTLVMTKFPAVRANLVMTKFRAVLVKAKPEKLFMNNFRVALMGASR